MGPKISSLSDIDVLCFPTSAILENAMSQVQLSTKINTDSLQTIGSGDYIIARDTSCPDPPEYAPIKEFFVIVKVKSINKSNILGSKVDWDTKKMVNQRGKRPITIHRNDVIYRMTSMLKDFDQVENDLEVYLMVCCPPSNT